MKTSVLDANLSTSESNLLKFSSHTLEKKYHHSNATQFDSKTTQTPINTTQIQNLGVWARVAIKSHKLTKENLKNSRWFRECSAKEQQAIRYQLRKKRGGVEQSDSMVQSTYQSAAKKSSGLTVSSLAILSVLGSEFILLTFACHFYLELGLSLIMAIVASVCVETFYLLSSSSQKLGIKLLRYPIYAYTIFTVCYSLYINDPKLVANNNQYTTQTELLRSQIEQQKQTSLSLQTQLNSALADMNVFRERGLVSRGRAAISEEKTTLLQKIEQSELKSEQLQRGLIALEIKANQVKNISVFSWEKVKLVEAKTWAMIAFLALIQLLASAFISEFTQSLSHSLREYFHRRKKLKSKFTKDVFWQAQTNS